MYAPAFSASEEALRDIYVDLGSAEDAGAGGRGSAAGRGVRRHPRRSRATHAASPPTPRLSPEQRVRHEQTQWRLDLERQHHEQMRALEQRLREMERGDYQYWSRCEGEAAATKSRPPPMRRGRRPDAELPPPTRSQYRPADRGPEERGDVRQIM